ncbi:DUF1508 domain-containing protein [Pseudarthrobacter sp. NBSH8]|nr:DUF1508 domain-containing protein [Pseudarthrobacter sp. NBSH8]QNE16518.1 DUF1508 domain-containing protein [Pseudarthrobacter sp. NBSH8]
MAGMFVLFVDAESNFRFRVTAPDGTVMAVSKAFDGKAAAVAGIAAVREYAGMGLIADTSKAAGPAAPPGGHETPAAQLHKVRHVPVAADLHARGRALRAAANGVRWAGGA